LLPKSEYVEINKAIAVHLNTGDAFPIAPKVLRLGLTAAI
jgi:hypothetical protein